MAKFHRRESHGTANMVNPLATSQSEASGTTNGQTVCGLSLARCPSMSAAGSMSPFFCLSHPTRLMTSPRLAFFFGWPAR
jgi:hypothetical protein